MRIGYITPGDPMDRRQWSGTHFQIARALRDHVGEVVQLGPLHPRGFVIDKVLKRLAPPLLGKRYLHTHSMSLARRYKRALEARLATEELDVLFAPAGSTLVALLETEIPLVYLSDATFALMEGYYPQFSNLMACSSRDGNEIERLALEKANLLIYPSSWASDSAIWDYGADPSRVHVVPFGANVEQISSEEAVRAGLTRPPGCRLLFVGVEWERKGGDLVLETFHALDALGLEPELTICGCAPPEKPEHPRIRVIPFLDRNEPAQHLELETLYAEATFVFVPSRQECLGMVFIEAGAFGTPVISTDVGGISTAIVDGVNGYLLPLTASGREYAQKIASLIADREHYLSLREGARKRFEQYFTWHAWGRSVSRLLNDLLS